MTIKQYAAEHKVSPQAVYQRLKKNKIRVETLTENGSGELTGEGIVILDKLFNPENRAIKPLKDEKIEALEALLAAIKADNLVLQEKVDSLTQRAEELAKDKDYFKQLLDNSQNTVVTLQALLPGETEKNKDSQRKLTWRERFTGKIKK